MSSYLSLYELNRRVRSLLTRSLPDECWLQAELSEVHVNSAGHCYVEFVQKDARSNALVAKARGTIWSNIFRLLRPYFERETGQLFMAGIKVLVQVRVDFHELYGYSLVVTDIDPSYTVGDLVRKRREILRQLEEEGVLTLNKELPLPAVPQRIAVISSSTAAGYGDFCNQLENNPYGFRFFPVLFPAIMQGDRAEASILEALDKIHLSVQEWDMVVIIRGGGATSDLSGFDTYLLAAACAQFPLPVITGIGHERDDTVLDLVAHTRVKTPTAAASFLVNRLREAADCLEVLSGSIYTYVQAKLEREKSRIDELARRLPSLVALQRVRQDQRLELLRQRMAIAVERRLQDQKHRLQILGQRLKGCDYRRLLGKGFSVTLKNGHVVTDVSQLSPGDTIVTRLGNGEVTSQVGNLQMDEHLQ
ncbi:MAG: exodeoxyribonuclease VII large subunit [Bacteroidaceae bacterium]|nr:exodeoxyribonuclease VII large subunit [Bacteroidaceae bacterium]